MTETTELLADQRVLIVEDEALIALAVEDEVRRLGCTEVFVAYNREQALHEIDSFNPAFAIIDVSLTDSGEDYAIADRLAEQGIPFIFSSGHLAGELPDRHVGRPFVGKPMVRQDFVDAVAMAMR